MRVLKPLNAKHWFFLPLLMLFAFSPNLIAQDDCSDATALSCGDVVTANTDNANDDDDAPQCGLQSLGHGLWYTIVGTGSDITLSTCNPGTNFDTQISLYTGSCGNLTCLDNNNNAGECDITRASEITFASDAGTTYYVLVGGSLGARGDYVLTVDCAAPPITNDDCEDAEPISCGQVVSGTTSGASSESLPFCGTSLSSAPGVWYVFTGTGDDIEVTTCNAGTNYDTKLGVFTGSCGDFACEGGDDDDSCPFSSLRSRVEFTSVAGTTYYIYVTGFGSNSGDYEVSLTCTTPPPSQPNDDCSDAIAISCNSSVTGNTVGANPESVSFCGTSLTSAGGVWYSFVGNGTATRVSTCNPGTNYDTKLGIFTGSCGGLVCVGGNDDQTGGTDPACVVTTSSFNRASTVEFTSVAGTTYYVLVTGFSTNEGDFELTVECGDGPGGGGDDPLTCEDATELECGDSVTGNTENGQINELGSCDGTDLDTAPGVFYFVEGTGDRIVATTCSDVTDYDSKIAAFVGSCGNLTCIAANNNDSDCTTGLGVRNATVDFISQPGQIYYIYVTGQLASAGNFELSIDCFAANDDCADALPIACGETVTGNTDNATADNGLPFCGTTVSGRKGVWYELQGTGTNLTASTCTSFTNYDTKLAVFEGSCDNLICVGGDDDDFGCNFSSLRSTVDFFADASTTYYILVTGFGTTSDGDFGLSISGSCSPGGGGGFDQDGIYDNVCDADDLEINTSYGFSNTTATAQPGEPDPGAGSVPGNTCNSTDGWCSFELDVDNSVWFKFVAPASGCINASAGTIDLQLAIWTVGDCNDFGTFTEIAANDDSGPGFSPQLTNLSVTPGATYYVQVDGYNGASTASGLVLVQDCGGSLVDNIGVDNAFSTGTTTDWNLSEAYPNPTAGAAVTLDLNAPREVPGQIFVMDNLGRVLSTQKEIFFQGENRLQVEMDGLAPGMYFISVQAGEQTFHRKVMVVRP